MPIDSNFDAKERIRQAVDIVDLVGSYLALRRQGRNFVGICPWHDDSRPSLQVNPERQTFKCWVCDLGGDVFSFVMQREGVEFPEALAMLAERAGVVLQPRGPTGGSESFAEQAATATQDKQSMYRAMAWAVERFHRCLLDSDEAVAARRYLQDRGINDESIDRFKIGYSPDDWTWLVDQVKSKPSAAAVLERVGLLGKGERGNFYDRFKGRVLFPIFNAQGKPIATGGRVLPHLADEAENKGGRRPAKYINSPETPLFSKNREFYALDLARDAIARRHNILIMEGYTDCVIAHQAGFDNSVAVLGTALGENHIRRLRFSDQCVITLVLDGDEAGRKRANEILELFVAAQVDLRILTLPAGLDPAEFLQQHGGEAFQERIDNAADALGHKMQTVTDGLDINDTHRANRAIEDILTTMAAAPLGAAASEASQIRQQQMLARLAREFSVSEVELRGRLASLRRKRRRPSRDASLPPGDYDQVAESINVNSLGNWERELLEIILCEPESISKIAQTIRPRQLGTDAARRIYAKCCELSDARIKPDFERLIIELEDFQLKNLLVGLDEAAREKVVQQGADQEIATRLADLLAAFERRRQERQRTEDMTTLQNKQLEEQGELQLIEQLLQQERTRQGISEPTDG